MASVKIIVESSLGDVEVEQEHAYSDGSFKGEISSITVLLEMANDKIRRAYKLDER